MENLVMDVDGADCGWVVPVAAKGGEAMHDAALRANAEDEGQ